MPTMSIVAIIMTCQRFIRVGINGHFTSRELELQIKFALHCEGTNAFCWLTLA